MLVDFIIGISWCKKVHSLEHTIAIAPFSIASFINRSPLDLKPLIAKNIKPFLIFLLSTAKPLTIIFFLY